MSEEESPGLPRVVSSAGRGRAWRASPTTRSRRPRARRRRRALRGVPRRHPRAREPHHREGRRGLRHQPAHLLVLLQKEQSLLTRPSSRRVRARDRVRMPRHRRLRREVLRLLQPGVQRGMAVPAVHRGARPRVPDRHGRRSSSTRMPRAARLRRDPQPGHRQPLQLHAVPAERRDPRRPRHRRRLLGVRQPQLLADLDRWFGDPEAERLPAFFPPCSRLVGPRPAPLRPRRPPGWRRSRAAAG